MNHYCFFVDGRNHYFLKIEFLIKFKFKTRTWFLWKFEILFIFTAFLNFINWLIIDFLLRWDREPDFSKFWKKFQILSVNFLLKIFIYLLIDYWFFADGLRGAVFRAHALCGTRKAGQGPRTRNGVVCIRRAQWGEIWIWKFGAKFEFKLKLQFIFNDQMQ